MSNAAEERVGTTQLLGRCHQLPRRIEDDYTLLPRVLGYGSSGNVCLAQRKYSSEQTQQDASMFAVKMLEQRPGQPDAALYPMQRLLESEVQTHLCMDHPHIVRLVNVYKTPESTSLVMEHLTGGELFHRVHRDKAQRLSESEAAHATWQMLLAVHYLHSQHYAHRDLKLENFLFEEPDSSFLKLIDFGFCTFRASGTTMHTALGTLPYVAPEVLTDEYTSQCDLWSLGVIVFKMLSGCMPFNGSHDKVTEDIELGQFHMDSEQWNRISREGRKFTRSLLRLNPTARLTAAQALESDWIQRYAEPEIVDVDHTVVSALQEYSQAPKFRRCCLLAIAWHLNQKDIMQLRKQFLALDVGHRGVVGLADLKAVLMKSCDVSEADVYAMFRVLDANRNGEISFSEFLAAMLSTRSDLHDQLLETAYRHFDQELAGHLTAEQLRRACGNAFERRSDKSLLAEVEDDRIPLSEFSAYVCGRPFSNKTLLKLSDVGAGKPGDSCQLSRQTSDDLLCVDPFMKGQAKPIQTTAEICCCPLM